MQSWGTFERENISLSAEAARLLGSKVILGHLHHTWESLTENKAGACMLIHVRLFVTPWTVARQAPLSIEFSRKEYWSRLPFPSPGNLPNPGI